ncbi:MAG: hypothetical protein LC804_17935 [Acidobacteria bacterium]|nr:hypothetical protein [Acidobacteriota bacterium]
MPSTGFRAAVVSILLTGGAFVSTAYGAQAQLERRPAQAAAQQPPAPVREMDAPATRDQLVEVLRKHPPAVARVLKLDPSLMRNESYLASYPSLREFLGQHPEIPQNVPYYLEEVRVSDGNWQPQNQRINMIENLLGGVAAFAAFLIVLSTLVWLIRTVLEQRRWSRLSKIQAEVHTKLMDRFSSNDELLSYVQTPSGRRFLESGPSPLEETPRTMGAPFSRILWSVQAGVVLLITGIGLLFLSGRSIEETRELFFICGCLAVALGAGFVVSAVASYALSHKLGLFVRSTTDHA